MDIVINPQLLCGHIQAIPSKSQAHRLLICSAFASEETTLICPDTNQDIEATVACLNALGAQIHPIDRGYHIQPVKDLPRQAVLLCRESGSTLRFLLPIAGALGVDTLFRLEGRLGKRPLSPLWEEMEAHGCCLCKPDENTIHLTGRLCPGQYRIAGNVSSQYITGLLFAAALIPGESSVSISGKLESAPYVEMTQQVMAQFGVDSRQNSICGGIPFKSPGVITVEGDWSNAAFFLAAGNLGSDVTVEGLNEQSPQGDRAVSQLLTTLKQEATVSGENFPDLIPILAVYAACHCGAHFVNIGRLRLKESDRIATVESMLRKLGCRVESTDDTLTVFPSQFRSCTIDAANDHRIAMSAAIAATRADGPVTIKGAQCVSKSYPGFWDAYKLLGGNYEQYIR